MSKYPRLPMRPDHCELIMNGRKRTTLRGKRLEGIYRLEWAGKSALVKLKPGQTLYRVGDLLPHMRGKLAYVEGYDSWDAFVKSCRSIHGMQAFLAGRRGLYVHYIEVVGSE